MRVDMTPQGEPMEYVSATPQAIADAVFANEACRDYRPIDYAAAFGAINLDVDLAAAAVERGDCEYALTLLRNARSHAEDAGRDYYERGL